MPHVVVLATGGTISSRSTARAVVAVDEASVLLTGLELGDGLTVEAHDVLRVGSYRLSLADMRAVAVEVSRQLHRDDVDGVVITHGTDTIEETAILLDLVHTDTRAVVLTGAQRAADIADTDGPRNLRDAVAVAGDSSARAHGVLVVFDGIGAGRPRGTQIAYRRPRGLQQPRRHRRGCVFGCGAHAQRPSPADTVACSRRRIRRGAGGHRHHLPRR